jgi:uncharacterized protein YndB with AHSA1/START domain
MSDRIEKRVELKAPVARVWRALTNHREFGQWFNVNLDGPFEVGKTVRGPITHPGYEHIVMEATVKDMDPERLFSFTWHPHAIDPSVDYSKEPQTRVEFSLEPTSTGTLLTVTESGFDKLPPQRRETAFRGNEGGWSGQIKNIDRYVTQNP